MKVSGDLGTARYFTAENVNTVRKRHVQLLVKNDNFTVNDARAVAGHVIQDRVSISTEAFARNAAAKGA